MTAIQPQKAPSTNNDSSTRIKSEFSRLFRVVSPYLTDKRLMTTIRNDYVVYSDILSDFTSDSRARTAHNKYLWQTKLLAMLIYRNIYISDAEKIPSGRSLLDDIYALWIAFRAAAHQEDKQNDPNYSEHYENDTGPDRTELYTFQDFFSNVRQTSLDEQEVTSLTLNCDIAPTQLAGRSFPAAISTLYTNTFGDTTRRHLASTLLSEGYIDEDFTLYNISLPDELPVTAANFSLHVIQAGRYDYSFPLAIADVEALLKDHAPVDMAQMSFFNSSILDYLLCQSRGLQPIVDAEGTNTVTKLNDQRVQKLAREQATQIIATVPASLDWNAANNYHEYRPVTDFLTDRHRADNSSPWLRHKTNDINSKNELIDETSNNNREAIKILAPRNESIFSYITSNNAFEDHLGMAGQKTDLLETAIDTLVGVLRENGNVAVCPEDMTDFVKYSAEHFDDFSLTRQDFAENIFPREALEQNNLQPSEDKYAREIPNPGTPIGVSLAYLCSHRVPAVQEIPPASDEYNYCYNDLPAIEDMPEPMRHPFLARGVCELTAGNLTRAVNEDVYNESNKRDLISIKKASRLRLYYEECPDNDKPELNLATYSPQPSAYQSTLYGSVINRIDEYLSALGDETSVASEETAVSVKGFDLSDILSDIIRCSVEIDLDPNEPARYSATDACKVICFMHFGNSDGNNHIIQNLSSFSTDLRSKLTSATESAPSTVRGLITELLQTLCEKQAFACTPGNILTYTEMTTSCSVPKHQIIDRPMAHLLSEYVKQHSDSNLSSTEMFPPKETDHLTPGKVATLRDAVIRGARYGYFVKPAGDGHIAEKTFKESLAVPKQIITALYSTASGKTLDTTFDVHLEHTDGECRDDRFDNYLRSYFRSSNAGGNSEYHVTLTY